MGNILSEKGIIQIDPSLTEFWGKKYITPFPLPHFLLNLVLNAYCPMCYRAS